MSAAWDGQLKAEARTLALTFCSDVVCAGIMLPGVECRDAAQALKIGTLLPRKPIYVLERDSRTMALIKSQMRSLGYLSVNYNHRIEEIVPCEMVDWAYLDFIGSLHRSTYQWFRDTLAPRLAPQHRISFCWNYAWRSPETRTFLGRKKEEMDESGILWDVSCRHSVGDYRIATYLAILEEIFPQSIIEYNDGMPYFSYNDNVNPMVLYTIRSRQANLVSVPQQPRSAAMPATATYCDLEKLIDAFASVKKNKDRMRGWKRSLTLYTRKRSEETGQPPYRFRAAVKMRLTKLGYSTEAI